MNLPAAGQATETEVGDCFLAGKITHLNHLIWG
jgi:hypothetical protein